MDCDSTTNNFSFACCYAYTPAPRGPPALAPTSLVTVLDDKLRRGRGVRLDPLAHKRAWLLRPGTHHRRARALGGTARNAEVRCGAWLCVARGAYPCSRQYSWPPCRALEAARLRPQRSLPVREIPRRRNARLSGNCVLVHKGGIIKLIRPCNLDFSGMQRCFWKILPNPAKLGHSRYVNLASGSAKYLRFRYLSRFISG